MICHINLAKGFRGGERQTVLLVNELAGRAPQRLIVRKGSPMKAMVHDNVIVTEIGKPFWLKLPELASCRALHAHETKGAQLALLAHLRYRKPYFITRRVPYAPSKNFFNRLLYHRATTVFTLSRAIDETMRRQFPEIETAIIPSARTPLPVTSQAQRLTDRFKGKFLVLHIGALVDAHKGQTLILDAAEYLGKTNSSIHFLLVGEGADRGFLEKRAEKLDNVTFEGFRKNIGDYLQAADLFIFPSREEGLGSILIDAMSFGKPIVATAVGGIVDLIQDGKTGKLIPPNDAHALAQAILSLYQAPDKAQALGTKAQEASGFYDIGHLAKRYLPYYAKAAIPWAKVPEHA